MPEPTPFEEVEVYDDEPYMWNFERLNKLVELAEEHRSNHSLLNGEYSANCEICYGAGSLILGLYDQVKLYHEVGFQEGYECGLREGLDLKEEIEKRIAEKTDG